MSFWEIPNDLKYMIGVEANKELPYDKKNYYIDLSYENTRNPALLQSYLTNIKVSNEYGKKNLLQNLEKSVRELNKKDNISQNDFINERIKFFQNAVQGYDTISNKAKQEKRNIKFNTSIGERFGQDYQGLDRPINDRSIFLWEDLFEGIVRPTRMVVGNDIIYRGNENKSASKLQAVVRRKIN